jgi:hypothetical protein
MHVLVVVFRHSFSCIGMLSDWKVVIITTIVANISNDCKTNTDQLHDDLHDDSLQQLNWQMMCPISNQSQTSNNQAANVHGVEHCWYMEARKLSQIPSWWLRC